MTRSGSVPRAVSMMIGTCEALRSSRHRSRPSPSGSVRSRRTRSGGWRCEARPRLGDRSRSDDLEALAGEGAPEGIRDGGLVLHEQDAGSATHGRLDCRAARRPRMQGFTEALPGLSTALCAAARPSRRSCSEPEEPTMRTATTTLAAAALLAVGGTAGAALSAGRDRAPVPAAAARRRSRSVRRSSTGPSTSCGTSSPSAGSPWRPPRRRRPPRRPGADGGAGPGPARDRHGGAARRAPSAHPLERHGLRLRRRRARARGRRR